MRAWAAAAIGVVASSAQGAFVGGGAVENATGLDATCLGSFAGESICVDGPTSSPHEFPAAPELLPPPLTIVERARAGAIEPRSSEAEEAPTPARSVMVPTPGTAALTIVAGAVLVLPRRRG